jgi:hypothetical protein
LPWSTEGVLGLRAVLQCGPSPSADLRMMAAGSRAAKHRLYKSRSRLGIAARPRATDLHGMLLVMGHHSGQPDQPPRPVEQPTGPHPAPADLDGRDAIRSDAGGDVHSAPTEATVTIQADASRYWKLHGRTHIGLLVLVLVVVFLESFRRGLHTTSGALVAVLTLYLAVTGRTWWHLLRGRIQVCVSQLVVQRLLGPSRIIPRGNLALAIYAPHYQLSGTNARARVPRLYLVTGTASKCSGCAVTCTRARSWKGSCRH